MRLVCMWPGLAATWHSGNLRGLVESVVFGWALSVLLVASFVWQEWLSGTLVVWMWGALAIVWLVEWARSSWTFKSMVEPTNAACVESFLEAQQAYIQGNWFDAEAILLEIVHQKPRDAEALLLLVGVLRHTRRWHPALRRLSQLEFLESAASWRHEIQRERALIERQLKDEEENAEVGEATVSSNPETDEGELAETPVAVGGEDSVEIRLAE